MASNTHSHHHHHRRWTWAHVQQGVRRNCLIGPMAFLFFVVVLAPYVIQDDHEFVQLPIVEAVPFFRRAKAMAFRKRSNQQKRQEQTVATSAAASSVVSEPTLVAMEVAGGAAAASTGSSSSDTALGATAAVAEPPAAEVVTEEEAATEEAAAKPVKKEETKPTASKKRTHSDTLKEYNFPLFAGHEAFEKDESAPIPFRYFEAHQHKNDVARKAVLGSLSWRKENEIDTILSRPQPNFDVAKRILPHYFIGRSAVSNHVVFVQRPGLADLALGNHNGLELQDMLNQYAFVFEYCWNILHTNTQTTMEGDKDLMIGIMDLQGLNLGVLRKADLISFVKEFVAMIDAHYPTRAQKTIMVNAPGWFSTVYKIVSPIMRETTKEKIVVYSAGKGQTAALEEALGKDMATTLSEALRVPDKKEKKKLLEEKGELALTSDILLETEMEQEMRQFVMQRLEADGLEMKKIKALSSK